VVLRSAGAGLAVGVGVGVAAALVRTAVFHGLRPPANWISWVLRFGLYLLPGAVVAAFATQSVGIGVVLWVGSLIGGAISVFFPVYVPEDARPRNDAAIAIYNAGRSDDKEAVLGYLDSPDPGIRSFAVGEIRRRTCREYAPELVRRLDVETDPEVRAVIAQSLHSLSPDR